VAPARRDHLPDHHRGRRDHRLLRRSGRAAGVALALVGLTAPAAVAGETTLPLDYNQGLAAVPDGIVFSGTDALFRVVAGREVARREGVIAQGIDFNHIGDIAYEGGRLLLPLECFNGFSNTCGRGAIGVADPVTLAWRYHVPLDPLEIQKAMWIANGPDGLLWTQSGNDLLAYRAADVAPGPGTPIHAVRRLAGVLPGAATGGAFLDGRLWLAFQDGLRSVDIATGTVRGESAPAIGAGEAEGLDAFPGLGGGLHWLVASGKALPTFGSDRSRLLTSGTGLGAAGLPARIRVRGRIRRGTLSVTADVFVVGRREPVVGGKVRAGGRSAFTGADGTAELRRLRGSRIRVQVTARGLRARTLTLRNAARRASTARSASASG
jgi:hypothetical protein